jgi:hypothetical protein
MNDARPDKPRQHELLIGRQQTKQGIERAIEFNKDVHERTASISPPQND